MMRTSFIVGLVVVGATGQALAQPPADLRFVVAASAGVQTRSVTRTDTFSVELFAESGTVGGTQTVAPKTLVDAGLSMRVWERVGAGVAVSSTGVATSADLDALVPHPFFFDFRRMATASAQGLRHRQTALHINGQVWLPVGTSTLVTVSAGPSFFDASQDLVSGIVIQERGFPFDDVDIVGHTVERVSVSAIGYNIGVDVTYFLFERVGLGFVARYSRATATVELGGAPQPTLDLGGMQAAGGLRFRF